MGDVGTSGKFRISGQSLDVCMGSKEHSIDDTLKLFAEICHAVNSDDQMGMPARISRLRFLRAVRQAAILNPVRDWTLM